MLQEPPLQGAKQLEEASGHSVTAPPHFTPNPLPTGSLAPRQRAPSPACSLSCEFLALWESHPWLLGASRKGPEPLHLPASSSQRWGGHLSHVCLSLPRSVPGPQS